MCGIYGFVYIDHNRPAEEHILRMMGSTLVHRGPDDDGHFINGNVALGHRRLSIIDIEGGKQPQCNKDENVWIVFNGEIYNFLELKVSLIDKGYIFKTNSDTEVIIHAYEEYGIDCLDLLDGMFVFAIWDKKKQSLFVARDRMGKKPLYYIKNNQGFFFASEIKALKQHPSINFNLSTIALHHFLTLQYVPDPYSIYENIYKLPPSHYCVLDSDDLTIKKYWDIAYLPKIKISENDAIYQLRKILKEAVRKRLISDVPLGAFLSGGVDSTIVVGLMAQLTDSPVKTFTIGFDYESFNELPHARAVADIWGTDHHEFIVSPENMSEMIPKLVQCFDEPFADSCAFQTYYLSQMTRSHVTVALNGDGGDETFAGYTRYWLDKYVRPYTVLPRCFTQDFFPKIIEWIHEPSNIAIEANWKMGLKRLAQVANITEKASIVRWGSYFSDDMKQEFYNNKMFKKIRKMRTEDLISDAFNQAFADGFLDCTLYADMRYYLPGNNLVKMDRMTMAHGLEARSPLLDRTYVEFVARLPESFKLKGFKTKYLLRKAFSDMFPKQLSKRAKRGFGAPVEDWIKNDMREMVYGILLNSDARIYELFDKKCISNMICEHQKGVVNHGKRIWTLLILEEWYRQQ